MLWPVTTSGLSMLVRFDSSAFNPFTAVMLAAPSLRKRPIKVTNL